jgi:hypothetical protein
VRRIWRWLGGNVVGVLTVVYFAVKFTLLFALWVVCGPLALVFMLFGSHLIFDLLDRFVDGLDEVAWKIYDGLERMFGLGERL